MTYPTDSNLDLTKRELDDLRNPHLRGKSADYARGWNCYFDVLQAFIHVRPPTDVARQIQKDALLNEDGTANDEALDGYAAAERHAQGKDEE